MNHFQNALSKMCFKESDLFGCIINGKFYMYRHEVPEKERWLLDFEDKADVRMGMIFMSTVFFYKADEPNEYLSNFYPSVFTIDNKTFNCVEQYFMWRKAMTKCGCTVELRFVFKHWYTT